MPGCHYRESERHLLRTPVTAASNSRKLRFRASSTDGVREVRIEEDSEVYASDRRNPSRVPPKYPK